MENDFQMFVCGVPISKRGNLMISANLVIKCAIAFAIVIGMFVSHKNKFGTDETNKKKQQ